MTKANASTTSQDTVYVSALYSIWAVQDTLLQNYRAMFITTESLLIAISATIATSDTPSRHQLSWLLIIVGLVLWGVWIIVTQSRARDVYFIQELIKRNEQGKYINSPFTTFKDYQNSWRKYGEYTIVYTCNESELFKPPKIFPPTDTPFQCFCQWGTRIHMEVTLPAAYLIGWFVVILLICKP